MADLGAEVRKTIKNIQSQKGVQGLIIISTEGIPIESSLDRSSTIEYVGSLHPLLMKVRSVVKDMDSQNDLTFLRIRSKKNEIMVAAENDYFMIVIQDLAEQS